MNSKKFIFPLLFIVVTFSVYADPSEQKQDVQLSSFDYLNELRSSAGMQAFTRNLKLEEAALNHANYCISNEAGGHFESKDHPGYTGYNHIERINFVNYLSRNVGENISSHNGIVDDKRSVDGLMSAIYHRFVFLSFDFDEIGIGKVQSGVSGCYVYNLGSMSKNMLCSGEGSVIKGAYYTSVCSDEDFRISADHFQAAEISTRGKNQSVVLWPSENSEDVPPAFFDETPDPLPDHSVSGYPVSIQFNPSVYTDNIPVVTRFELFDEQTGELLEIIKHMDEASDLNNKLKASEHVIFPLHRLQWAKRYRAEVDYSVENKTESIRWFFNTRELNVPFYLLTEDKQLIEESSGQLFTVYMPPRHKADADKIVRTRYKGLTSLDVQVLDGNTLSIIAHGSGEAEITFHGITFKVII